MCPSRRDSVRLGATQNIRSHCKIIARQCEVTPRRAPKSTLACGGDDQHYCPALTNVNNQARQQMAVKDSHHWNFGPGLGPIAGPE